MRKVMSRGVHKKNLFISLVDESLKDVLFKTDIGFNLELALFTLPEVLDGPWEKTVQKIKPALHRFPIRRMLHGPFMELVYNSRDAKVRALARKRILQGLEIARELGAEKIVFHSTYNPLVVDKGYPPVWLKRSKAFWEEMVPLAKQMGCVIVIENIFDRDPRMIKRLIRAVGSPYLKGCLDIGHAHLFGNQSLAAWVRQFGNDLSHVHMHDNRGTYDDHMPLGKGSVPIKTVFSALKKYQLQPTITMEVRNVESAEKSMVYLRKHKLLLD